MLSDERLAAIKKRLTDGCAGHEMGDIDNPVWFDCLCFEEEAADLLAEVLTLRSMLPEQYSAGFRDGMAAASPLDPTSPVLAGSS